jgi:hypothetical protein
LAPCHWSIGKTLIKCKTYAVWVSPLKKLTMQWIAGPFEVGGVPAVVNQSMLIWLPICCQNGKFWHQNAFEFHITGFSCGKAGKSLVS